MAYLGFQKGGPNFRWPLVLTQRGQYPVFFSMVKNFFFAKGGLGPMAPLNMPLDAYVPNQCSVGGGKFYPQVTNMLFFIGYPKKVEHSSGAAPQSNLWSRQ